MGRHATVAGRQASSANARSRAFTKVARELMVAAKLGGSDPAANPRLRLAMDHAREVNMPKDTVERAVKKGAGELEGIVYEEATYECYGPAGIALIIDVLTDNRNRTMPELKRIFQKNGANMAGEGAVAWMFKRRGVIDVSLQGSNEDAVMEVALDAGADDVQAEGEMATIFTEPQAFSAVRGSVEKAGLKIERSGLELVAENNIKIAGDDAKTVWNLINALEDQDDVQHVYHNADFSAEDLAKF